MRRILDIQRRIFQISNEKEPDHERKNVHEKRRKRSNVQMVRKLDVEFIRNSNVSVRRRSDVQA